MSDSEIDQDLEELERTLRAGLHEHAEDVVVSSAVLDEVRAATRRRRRTRWSVLGAAAAAVVGIGVSSVVVAGNDAERPQIAVDLPQDWRAESWAGLTVDVPADWGYGSAPDARGVACAPGPASHGGDARGANVGWVGRPVLTSDVCTDDDVAGPFPAPYVWLGNEIEPGTVDLGGGVVQETVVVQGTTLTVASDDPALRQRVLDSARSQTLCDASFGDVIPSGVAGTTDEGRGDLTAAHLCAYRSLDGAFVLVAADTVAPEDAAAGYAAQEAAPPVTHEAACMGDLKEFVILDATYDDPFGEEPLRRRAVYELGCGGEVSLGEGVPSGSLRTHLVREGIAPWATEGMRWTLTGPASRNGMGGIFIGMQG